MQNGEIVDYEVFKSIMDNLYAKTTPPMLPSEWGCDAWKCRSYGEDVYLAVFDHEDDETAGICIRDNRKLVTGDAFDAADVTSIFEGSYTEVLSWLAKCNIN